MDERPLPTADELGISEAEYERILRDVRRRQAVVGQPLSPPSLEAFPESYAGPPSEPPPPGQPLAPYDPPAAPTRRRGWKLWAALAVAAVIAARLVSSPEPEPAYAFLKTVGGKPVAYTSCKPIRVAVYPAGGPADADALVREAVAKMRSATGLDIVLVGSFGGHAPNWNFESAPVHPEDPISVSWQDGDAIAELTDEVVGLGVSRIAVGRNESERLAAGTIALSRDYFEELDGRDDRDQALAILLHEFGHVFGLAHVDSENELMHPVASDLTSFGPGDREGLRLLGQGPCS